MHTSINSDPEDELIIICFHDTKMQFLSTGQIPKDSLSIGLAAITCNLNPREIRNIAIISSSSSSFLNECSVNPLKLLAERSLQSLRLPKTKAREGSKITFKAIKNSVKKRRPFWRKLLFGSESKKVRSIILLNVVSLVYASDILVIKEAEAFMDPAAFSAVRFAMCAIPFLPLVFKARDDSQTRNAGLELGLWISLGYLIEALGLLDAEAGRASFLSLFTVIVVPLLQSLLGTIVPTRTWFGVLMSVMGLGMLEFGGSPPNVGDLLNFLSAIFFGIHTLRTEHISKSTKQDKHLTLLGYEVCVVAILSALWCILGGGFDGLRDTDNITWTQVWDWMVAFPWIPALYTGIFSTGLCLWAEISAMRDVSATETAMIIGMEPLWGAAFAWFLLGERWGPAGWMGAALILGGSMMVQMYEYLPKEIKGVKNDQVVEDKKRRSNLSATPVVIRSKDVMDVLKK